MKGGKVYSASGPVYNFLFLNYFSKGFPHSFYFLFSFNYRSFLIYSQIHSPYDYDDEFTP